METYKNLKKSTKIGLIISTVLLAAVLVNEAFVIGKAFSLRAIPPAILAIIDVVMCAIILLYAFFGYKKPHGNMLKLVFFAFAIYLAVQGTIDIATQNFYIAGDLFILAGLFVAYVAGRLNKLVKNKFLLFFIGMLIFARAIIIYVTSPFSFGMLDTFGLLSQTITFTAIVLAYVARYEEHKAAGLEDK